jgi:hypothetical protein
VKRGELAVGNKVNSTNPDMVPRQEWQRLVVELAQQLSPEQKAQARQVLYEKLLGRKS